MLIKVTNYCSMGCSHCMESSTKLGAHMPVALFEEALDFTVRLERLARHETGYRAVLLSGGECTEHPEFLKLLDMTVEAGFVPMLITNGSWLGTPLEKEILRPDRKDIFIQVTNDTRFYPKRIQKVDDPRISYIDSLSLTVQLGRFRGKTSDLPSRQAPSSFNFRSMTRTFRSAEKAISTLRGLALTGKSGHCSPSVSSDGSFVAGETQECFKVGTVKSTNQDITEAVLAMKECNRCSVEALLGPKYRAAIGL